MRIRISRKLGVAVVLSAGTVLYGAKAAAFIDIGGDVILADILANTTKQLALMTQSLSELRRSYGEVKRVAEYADDAANAARSFRTFSARTFGERFQSDLESTSSASGTRRSRRAAWAGARGRRAPGPCSASRATASRTRPRAGRCAFSSGASSRT
jgi:hypothetical protein